MKFPHHLLLLCLIGPLTSLGALAAQCGFAHGQVGKLTIGEPIRQIENTVGRKLPLRFAGEGKSSSSLDDARELTKLSLAASVGAPVTSIDMYFVESPHHGSLLEQIHLGIPCTAVAEIRSACQINGITVKPGIKDGWMTNVKNDPKARFIWGAEMQAMCSFWLRAR